MSRPQGGVGVTLGLIALGALLSTGAWAQGSAVSEGVPLSPEEELAAVEQRIAERTQAAQQFRAAAAEFTEALRVAPERTRALRERLERELGEPVADVDAAGVPVDTLQRWAATAEADLAVAEGHLAEQVQRLDAAYARPAAARERLREVGIELAGLEASSIVATDNRALAAAREAERAAAIAALSAERTALEKEIAAHEPRVAELLALRDEAEAARRRIQQRLEELRRLVAQGRSARAAQDLTRVKEARAGLDESATDPLVTAILDENLSTATETVEDANSLAELARLVERARDVSREIRERHRGAKARLDAVGMTPALGKFLLENPSDGKDTWLFRTVRRQLADELGSLTIDQLRLSEEVELLGDPAAWLRARQGVAAQAADDPGSVEGLLEALRGRRQLLRTALEVKNEVLLEAGQLQQAIERVSEARVVYDDFIAEHLLWVRTADPFDGKNGSEIAAGARWLFSAQSVKDAVTAVAQDLPRSSRGVVLAAALLLWLLRIPILRSLRALGPGDPLTGPLVVPTVRALVRTAWLVTPVPLAMFALGRSLHQSATATEYAATLGGAFAEGAAVAALYLTVVWLCVGGGVAERHFGWPDNVRRPLRRVFLLAAWLLTPVVVVAVALRLHPDPPVVMELRRAVLLLLLTGTGLAHFVLLHPRRGIVRALADRQPAAERWVRPWFVVGVGVPVVLVATTLAGYVLSTSLLMVASFRLLGLVLVITIAHQVVVLALGGMKRRAQVRAAAETTSDQHSTDWAELDTDTYRLVGAATFIAAMVGCWLIWSDLLPALEFLDRVVLWQRTVVDAGVSQQIPLTLADVLRTVFLAAVAVLAARHLPVLLEIVMLQQRVVSDGARYALIKLTRYTVAGVGIVVVLAGLGFSWSQLQWLVAALGVGIGFGLQEIIANFISGLIVLFERPIRVGDVVTVGDTTGTVTRINIRATTIRNWDAQELLVPNKEFITGRLLNWTLSDQINRVSIPVGIEYGADVTAALETLAAVAREHPSVLDDPAPVVSFDGFGDNALGLTLRCHLGKLDGRVGIVTELHRTIEQRFREAGIGMAFPQQDVHLSMAAPLKVVVQRESSEGSG